MPRARAHTHTNSLAHSLTHSRTHAYTHMHIHTHTRICTHAHAHAHAHARRSRSSITGAPHDSIVIHRRQLVDLAIIDDVNSDRRPVLAHVYGRDACVTRTSFAQSMQAADGLAALMPLLARSRHPPTHQR